MRMYSFVVRYLTHPSKLQPKKGATLSRMGGSFEDLLKILITEQEITQRILTEFNEKRVLEVRVICDEIVAPQARMLLDLAANLGIHYIWQAKQ